LNSNTHINNFTEKKFEELFKLHFVPLCAYGRKYIYDIDAVKEIVHDVYINLWDKRKSIDTDKPVKSYLYTSVHNRCLNYIRDNKKFDRGNVEIENINLDSNWENSDKLVEAELENNIKMAIDSLPPKCREVFMLNRFENLKYAEVAKKLNISVKTVEAQISKALKILKEKLADYLTVLMIILYEFFN